MYLPESLRLTGAVIVVPDEHVVEIVNPRNASEFEFVGADPGWLERLEHEEQLVKSAVMTELQATPEPILGLMVGRILARAAAPLTFTRFTEPFVSTVVMTNTTVDGEIRRLLMAPAGAEVLVGPVMDWSYPDEMAHLRWDARKQLMLSVT